MLLEIDTSTEKAGLALTRDGFLIAELVWDCGYNHSVELLPRLQSLLQQQQTTVSDLTGVVVARGPGSFNGLRVGVSTAKGIAFSCAIPVVGISTLEYTAWQHAVPGIPVCAVFNAGRGEISSALFRYDSDSGWKRLVEEHITTIEALSEEIQERCILCGEYVALIKDQLTAMFGERALLPPDAGLVRRPAFLAELGQKRLTAGEFDDPATLQPLYLRRPPITKSKKRTTIEWKA